MEITNQLVDKIANLARLHVAPEDKERVKEDLQKMVSFVEKLKEVDTTGMEPLLHISPNINVLRADEVQGSINREEALKNAVVNDGEFFKVPKVMKK